MVYNVNTNRENMKKILFLFFGLFFMITWQSCDERDDIRKDIDELNARLDGIQPLIIQLNKDIVSYKALLDGSLWIVDFTVNSCGDYTIRFNDGSDMTVYSGETDEEIPQVAIGEDGIWYYTQNGEKYPLLGSDGNPAPVFGENGVTPQIRINNKTGRWEYSLDQGTTWQGDLGAALPRNGISVFDDVAYSKNEDGGEFLVFRWHTGDIQYEKKIGLFSGLDLTINYGSESSSPVAFSLGAVKTFSVTQIGVAKALIETNTWGVELNENEIKITAPDQPCEDNILIKILSPEGYCKLIEIPVKAEN